MALSEPSRRSVEDFYASIKSRVGAYRHDSFAYLAMKTATGFELILGTLLLNVERPALPPKGFQSASVKVGHFRLADLGVSREAFIEQICAGKITIADDEFLFSAEGIPASPMITFWPLNPESARAGSRVATLRIAGGRDTRSQIDINQIDWELRAGSPTFEGLHDLLNEYGIHNYSMGNNRVDVFAHSVARILSTSTINGEAAKISVWLADGLAPAEVAVGCRVLDQGRVVKRLRVSGDDIRWQRSENHQIGEVEFPVPRAAIVDCTAIYSEVAQHHDLVSDPTTFQNERRAAYEAIDPGLETLRETLAKSRENNSDSRAFEGAITRLFWMLGFGTAHIDGNRETPDILLAAPSGDFLVIECTTVLLKPDYKFAHLYKRTRDIQRSLSNSGTRHLRVLPVIVTSSSSDDVKPGIQQAGKLGIHVIGRAEIDQMVEQTIISATAEQILESIAAVAETAPSNALELLGNDDF